MFFFLILVKNNGQWGRFYPRLFCFSWIVVIREQMMEAELLFLETERV